jgi:AcrR family transcriptional regulator
MYFRVPESSGQGATLAATEQFPALPRGRSSLPESVVRATQRQRLLRAVISVSAETGYADMTIADIVERARVSRNAFYEHFRDKQASFIAACTDGAEVMFAHISDAAGAAAHEAAPDARLRAGLRAYLDFISNEPEFARCFTIECFAAGREALAMRTAAHRRFADMHRDWHRRARKANPHWPPADDFVYHAMVGATYEVVVALVRDGRTDELPALEEMLMPVLMRMLGVNGPP